MNRAIGSGVNTAMSTSPIPRITYGTNNQRAFR